MISIDIFFAVVFTVILIFTLSGDLEPSMFLQSVGAFFVIVYFYGEIQDKKRKRNK